MMYFAGESACLSLTTTTSAVAASSSLPTGTPPTVLALADTTADGIVFNLISNYVSAKLVILLFFFFFVFVISLTQHSGLSQPGCDFFFH